jgi:hypothetical protein
MYFSSGNLVDNTGKPDEDMDCLLFDADNDKDLDLLVTYGDSQPYNSSDFAPKLFINDGKGNFTLKQNAIPADTGLIAGTVTAGDYDSDGDLDLFIGGRVTRAYPLSPRSFLLQNSNGIFSDVTAQVCPSLQRAGMITGSAWTDLDNDKLPDLIIAGEWMPVRFFKNVHGRLHEYTDSTGLGEMDGMWRSLAVADIDNDGDEDIIAGNLGLNCNYDVSKDQPMQLFAKDLDGNGSIDPVFFYYIKGGDGKKHLYPAISRAMFADQVPSIKKQFLLAKDYSKASFEEIFPAGKREGVLHLSCNETKSCWLENLGNGKFKKHVLPVEAQFAPINSIVCNDVDGDGYKDLIIAGNEYQQEVNTGRIDASYGLFLKGDREKTFKSVPSTVSGFILEGDVRDMELIPLSNQEKILVVTVNNDSLRVFRIRDIKIHLLTEYTKLKVKIIFKTIFLLLLIVACNSISSPNKEMVLLLRKVSKETSVAANSFCPEAGVAHFDSLIQVTHDPYKLFELKNSLGIAFLKLGKNKKRLQFMKSC